MKGVTRMKSAARMRGVVSMKGVARRGFTIVEVTLAMSFLSVLLMTVAFLTIHITTIYQKGLSIKAVTLTGEQLVDEFSRAIASSSSLPVESLCSRFSSSTSAREQCVQDNARKYIYQVRYATKGQLGIMEKNSDIVPASGLFCSGRYSYLWNSGYVLNDANEDAKNYAATMHYPDGTESSNFRLLKIVDLERSLCAAHINDNSNVYRANNLTASTDTVNRSYSSSEVGTIEEVITGSEDNLALYSFDIFRPATHNITNHAFYSGTFILATIQGGIDITAQGDYCKDAASLDFDTDFNYCAINKFNFAMRATGENKS